MDFTDKKVLCSMLSFVHQTMIASVPLLKFALERADDPRLVEYYTQHIDEESGHDVMLADDLARLGCVHPRVSFLAAQLAGAQYYLIAHDDPALLLGYMLALESESMTEMEVNALSSFHGVNLTAMRHHAEHDPQHAEDLRGVIDGLPEPLAKRVMANAVWVTEFLLRAEKEIVNGYH